jgi:hypothetical protein
VPETGKIIEYMLINSEEQAELARRMDFDIKNSFRDFLNRQISAWVTQCRTQAV